MIDDQPSYPLPEPAPPSPLRDRFAAIGQATAFAVLTVILWVLSAWLLHGQTWITNQLVLSLLSLAPAVSASNALFVILNPGASWDALGISFSTRGLVELAAGILGGAALALAIVGIQWLLGWITVFDANSAPAAEMEEILWEPGWFYAVVVLFFAAASEELLFRGFGLQQLMRAANPWIAVVGTSALFGLVHASNPGASRVGLVNTALFGCLFGVLLVRRRSLMTPIGAHFGWNFTLVAIGVSLSGLRIKVADVMLTSTGPILWSGGSYGPEASLIASLAVPVVIGIVLWLPLRSDTGPRLWD